MSRDRDLNLLVAAVGLSALGDFLALVPLSLHLKDTTDSGVLVAALFIALWSPSVALAAPAGFAVDRLDARRVLLAVSLAQAAVSVVLAFASGTAAILGLAALLGVGFAFASPAEFALIPGVVADDRLAAANGRIETARYLGFTIGPLAGGALAAAGGLKIALLVNAASFVAVAAVAGRLRVRDVQRAAARPEVSTGRARDGAAYLLRDPTLRVVMVVAFASLLFMTASAAAEVFFAKDVLDAGDLGYGALLGAWTLGMAVGALTVAGRVAPAALASGALVAIAVQGAGLALPTLWLVLAFALGGYLLGGVAHGTKNVVVRTLMHRRVPEQLHGRAFAAYNAIRNGAELVALAGGGLLVAAVGARVTLFVAGAVPAAAALGALAFAWRRLAVPAVSDPAPG